LVQDSGVGGNYGVADGGKPPVQHEMSYVSLLTNRIGVERLAVNTLDGIRYTVVQSKPQQDGVRIQFATEKDITGYQPIANLQQIPHNYVVTCGVINY
jgi:hypothetical protein